MWRKLRHFLTRALEPSVDGFLFGPLLSVDSFSLHPPLPGRSTTLRYGYEHSYRHQRRLFVSSFVSETTSTSFANASTIPVGSKLYLGPWMERVLELQRYAKQHGHCRVPKRYKENPALGNWVNKQRVEYRKYQQIRAQHHEHGSSNQSTISSSLTEERIALLNQLGFCWNATAIAITKHSLQQSTTTVRTPTATPPKDQVLLNDKENNHHLPAQWMADYKNLRQYMMDNNLDSVHQLVRDSPWDKWVQQTRQEWHRFEQNSASQEQLRSSSQQRMPYVDSVCPPNLDYVKNETTGTHIVSAAEAMSQLDRYWNWTSRRAVQWERQWQALVEFQAMYGHTCVPISFPDNPSLAHWVSTQRKQYNQWQRGKKTCLTTERRLRLQSLNFVWNRWDYEFEQKQRQEQQNDQIRN